MDCKNFIDGLIKDENKKLENAKYEYGEYYETAIELAYLFYKFIYYLENDGFIFIGYLSQAQKHLLLSIFSSIRLHYDQSDLNLRKAIESSILACYSIVYTNENNYIYENGKTLSKPLKKHYDWFEDNFKIESNYFKGVKDIINSGSSHSNFGHAMLNVNHRQEEGLFECNFFDKKIDIIIKTNLNTIGRIILINISILNKLNEKYNLFKLRPDFKEIYYNLIEKSNKQKKELRELGLKNSF